MKNHEKKTTIKNIEFHSILLYFYKERKRRKKFLFLIDSHLYIGPMGSLPKYSNKIKKQQQNRTEKNTSKNNKKLLIFKLELNRIE